jgi:molybdopterin-containing oxidoreductase family membrane subunit
MATTVERTPPPRDTTFETMSRLSWRRVNETVLRSLEAPGKAWYIIFAIDLAVLGIGVLAFLNQLVTGLGVAGYAPPVMWATYITTFVFWVGIAHSGTLISAILFLFRARWRVSVYRVAEAMTVFAVMTAGLFPLIHIGRPWVFYWLLPYPSQGHVWPQFKSPLVWDVFAVSTYFTVSATFFVVGLIPDIAAARDASTGWRKRFYGLLAFGWGGSSREWLHYSRAYMFLAAFATPLVLSVHSVVSWDFAMGIIPGWHTTIFAPYFVAGAIFSGCALVLTLVIPARKIFGVEEIITTDHLDALAKLCLFTGSIVAFAYGIEFWTAWYSGNAYERGQFWFRATGDYKVGFWTMVTCNVIIPQLFLWFRRVRRSTTALFILSIVINIGMWFERYVIIVLSLSHDFIPFAFGSRTQYAISPTELAILIGSFAWFGMFFLLFIKFLPWVAITEVKEVLPPPVKNGAGRGGAH